jgi:hypothetical protein
MLCVTPAPLIDASPLSQGADAVVEHSEGKGTEKGLHFKGQTYGTKRSVDLSWEIGLAFIAYAVPFTSTPFQRGGISVAIKGR